MSFTADCLFLTDGAMTGGLAVFTSASNPFVSGDVGKTICIAGAGAGGGALITTITAFNGAGSVNVHDAASATVSGAVAHYGTDNTAAINAALAALTSGGEVTLGPGYFLTKDINLTGTNSVTLSGAAWGINASGKGTVLVPATTGNIVDMTGSGGVALRNIQIGTSRSAVTANVGILCAQISGSATSSLVKFDNVFVTGNFATAALYNYGVGDSLARDSNFWNLIGTSKYGAVFTDSNDFGVTSAYQSISTATSPAGNWLLDKCEFHDFKGSGNTTGAAIYINGASSMDFESCLIDSASSSGAVEITGLGATQHRWGSCTFDGQGALQPSYIFNIQAGYTNPSFDNCYFSYAAAPFTGSGAMTTTVGQNIPLAMPPGSSNGGAATVYFGLGQCSAAEFDVGIVLRTRMIICNLYAQANGGVSVGSHTLTVEKNGSATGIAATLTGGAPTASDATHWGIFNAGDRIAIKDTAAGGASSVRFTAAVAGISF